MHYHEAIYVNTITTFLQKIEEFMSKGYSLTFADTDKRIVFDGKNTVECQADVCVAFAKGTATYTIIYTI